jgi:carbon monoxide dehydrogenase subunit G
MELVHEFSVGVPVDEAWAVLTDLERIAPCMPGAELQEVDGLDHRGVVKVKVGPMTARYQGVARFEERDEARHRAVVRAEGREARGQGNAAATITATLAPDGGGTRVSLVTDLKISGKVAQFGRGVLADVSGKLLDQFVRALEADVLAGAAPTPGPGAESGARPPAARPESTVEPVEPVDLVGTAGTSVLKRVGPVLALLVVVAWLVRRR